MDKPFYHMVLLYYRLFRLWNETQEPSPDGVFGLKHFPNAEFKKDYIIHDPNTNYTEQVEMLKAIESNLAAIKSGLAKIMPNYPQYRTKLLFKPDIF